MVDLVLQDAGVPACSLEVPRSCLMVEVVDTHSTCAENERGEAGKAEAALEEILVGRGFQGQHRVDKDLKGNRRAFPLGEGLGADVFHVIGLVLDDGELEAEADLGRGEADSGGLVHGFAHVLDELLDGGREDLFAGEFAGGLAEDRFSGELDFEGRGFHWLRFLRQVAPGLDIESRAAVSCE